jgi:hypothetical protein
MTTAAVLVPIAVATGSGAPPLPVSADLTSNVPVVAAAGALPASTVAPPSTSPDLTLPSGAPRPVLAATGATDALDIPSTALAAYQRATAVISRVDAACALSWDLLAAVGRIESDHGRVGGAILNPDGTSTPAVRGPVLDGKGPVAAVADTDAGQYDGNTQWDRAIGPMQFLPSTWSVVGVDADGDGSRSADDIDDAALGAAVYLCAGAESLDTAAGARAALLRYNPSAAYATKVLAVAQAYEEGRYLSPFLTPVETIIARTRGAGDETGAAGGLPPKHGGTTSAILVADHPTGGAKQPRPPRPPKPPKPSHPPTKPTPVDPGPADPTPTDPTPAPPATVTLTGLFGACQDDATAWCLDAAALDLGDDAYLGATALGDFDADGVVETNREEITGLVGARVALTVTGGSTPARIVEINALDYVRAAEVPPATP